MNAYETLAALNADAPTNKDWADLAHRLNVTLHTITDDGDLTPATSDDTPAAITIPHTGQGHSGYRDTWGEANRRALATDYAHIEHRITENPTAGNLIFIFTTEPAHLAALNITPEDDAELATYAPNPIGDMHDAIAHLADYPFINDDYLSEVEEEVKTEEWHEWAHSETVKHTRDILEAATPDDGTTPETPDWITPSLTQWTAETIDSGSGMIDIDPDQGLIVMDELTHAIAVELAAHILAGTEWDGPDYMADTNGFTTDPEESIIEHENYQRARNAINTSTQDGDTWTERHANAERARRALTTPTQQAARRLNPTATE